MRWFQVVVALLGGVVCKGVRVLLYVLRAMPYNGRRPFTLPAQLPDDLSLGAAVIVIAFLTVVLLLVGARLPHAVGGAFLAYLIGFCTYEFTRSLSFFSPLFQNYEVQVFTLIVGGGILCGGLVVGNPAYPRWTPPVLFGTTVLGCIAAVNVIRTYSDWAWLNQSTYIVACTVYGLILVLAWRKPVEDTLGEGEYALGKGGDAPAVAPERPVR